MSSWSIWCQSNFDKKNLIIDLHGKTTMWCEMNGLNKRKRGKGDSFKKSKVNAMAVTKCTTGRRYN